MIGIRDKIASSIECAKRELVEEVAEEEKSYALIVKSGEHGLVIQYKGIDLTCMIEEYLPYTDELGLEDAPEGLSVWEGIFQTVRSVYAEWEGDHETEPFGEFRRLTDEEFNLLREGKDIFIKKDFKA